ncbi:unnamed protein product [Ceratitis capitata]|uniref:(Mediterranean fruit fly) hypothetical protein n=1 Tax=Ceratitis capitata TaxID=7213 RepID=A0A811VJ50_CERCA|nr:unnamed protein product [Ceratitis capitata]
MATHSSILAWEMPRREEPEGRSPWVVLKLGSTQQLRTQVFPKTTLKCPAAGPFVLPPPLPGALALAQELAQASCLPWRGRASVCVSVCVPACGSSALSGRSRAWRGVKGGASVVRRGGAEALRSTAPPWLLRVWAPDRCRASWALSSFAAPRPAGASEAPGPRGWEAAGAEDRHIRRGPRGLSSSEWDPGPAQPAAGSGVAAGGGRRDLRTPQPSPQPRAHAPRTHALPVNGGSWNPSGPPGPARRLLVWYGRCSGGGPASAGLSPVAGLAAQVQHAPRREVRPVGPTCRQSEREATQGS